MEERRKIKERRMEKKRGRRIVSFTQLFRIELTFR